MALVYNALGVEAKSSLNSEQSNDFFNIMKKSVWKVQISVKQEGDGVRRNFPMQFFTGVCIAHDGLILTRFIDAKNVSNVYLHGPNGETYAGVKIVNTSENLGLALLKPRHVKNCDFVEFAPETTFDVEQSLYAFVYPEQASSPIFLVGCLAYPHSPESGIYRSSGHSELQDYLPNGFGAIEDVCLLQIAGLGASCESFPRGYTEGSGAPAFDATGPIVGLEEGRGAPVFDAIGRLVGLIAFNRADFDFAIHVNELKEFCH